MDIAIGPFDPATRTVPVTFARGGVTHQRPVNAVLDEEGEYDAEATGERVCEVALGVAYKIDAGILSNPAPPPEPEPEPAPEPTGEDPED